MCCTNFLSAALVDCPVAQRQSTRPITARPRLDTVRDNQHQELAMSADHKRRFRTCDRSSDRPGLLILSAR